MERKVEKEIKISEFSIRDSLGAGVSSRFTRTLDIDSFSVGYLTRELGVEIAERKEVHAIAFEFLSMQRARKGCFVFYFTAFLSSDFTMRTFCSEYAERTALKNVSCSIYYGLSSCVKVVPIAVHAPITNRYKSEKFKVQKSLSTLLEYPCYVGHIRARIISLDILDEHQIR